MGRVIDVIAWMHCPNQRIQVNEIYTKGNTVPVLVITKFVRYIAFLLTIRYVVFIPLISTYETIDGACGALL